MTKEQIKKLVDEFTEKTLPKSKWTHDAHIIVAIWHNWHFEFNKALKMVKEKIIAYNKSVGIANTDNSGYYKSLTIFWMILTKNYITDNNCQSIKHAYLAFLESGKALKSVPLEYYSKETLFSIQARKEWVNGDIMQIEKTNTSYKNY